jgi:hypothetical protein
LAFCIPSGRPLCRNDGLIERDFASQVGQKLGQADRLHRRQFGIEAALGKRSGLGERARLDHSNKAHVAGGIEPVARRRQENCGQTVIRLAVGLALPLRDRHARRLHDLEGSDQALLVPRREPPGSSWIELRQALAECSSAQSPVKCDCLLPDLLGNLRDRRQARFECAQIEPGAADQDRQAAGACRGSNLVAR